MENKEKNIFLSDYVFHGKYATYVEELVETVIDSSSQTHLFRTNVDVFAVAAIVGCFFGLKETPINTDNSLRRTIPQSAFTNRITALNVIYSTVLLMTERDITSIDDRVNRAFRNPYSLESYNLFEQVMLGGLVKLHDSLLCNEYIHFQDFLNSTIEFLHSFDSSLTEDADEKLADEIIMTSEA